MNGIDWNEQKDLVLNVSTMSDSNRVDIQTASLFLHHYILDKSGFDLPVNNENINIYYQLIGSGALMYALETIEKETHQSVLRNKEGKVISRFYSESDEIN